MDGLIVRLTEWYETSRLLYAAVSTISVIAVGSLIGWLMDLIGRRLGVDTHAVKHHRQHL